MRSISTFRRVATALFISDHTPPTIDRLVRDALDSLGPTWYASGAAVVADARWHVACSIAKGGSASCRTMECMVPPSFCGMAGFQGLGGAENGGGSSTVFRRQSPKVDAARRGRHGRQDNEGPKVARLILQPLKRLAQLRRHLCGQQQDDLSHWPAVGAVIRLSFCGGASVPRQRPAPKIESVNGSGTAAAGATLKLFA